MLTLPGVVAGFAPLVSLLSTLSVAAVPNGVVALSLTASIRLIVRLVVLLPALPSLAAPVVPVTPTLVCVVSVPPAVPGIVTVIGQLIVPPAAKLATGKAGVHVPTTTVAPAGTPAAAVHVGFVAAAPPAAFVHVNVPLSTAPGEATVGNPVIATLMSAAGPTTIVAVAVSHAVGVTAGFAQI
jgi:hypothetical protein